MQLGIGRTHVSCSASSGQTYEINNKILQIKEAFGKYGEFANTHKTGNTLFVRYDTYETASQCYKAYNNHPVYRVKPARKRGGGNTSGFQR